MLLSLVWPVRRHFWYYARPLSPTENAAKPLDQPLTARSLTLAQRDLRLNLEAIGERHGWSIRDAQLEVMAGPRAFDVRCVSGAATLWHWVGTSEQILATVDRWLTGRRTTHSYEFVTSSDVTPASPVNRQTRMYSHSYL